MRTVTAAEIAGAVAGQLFGPGDIVVDCVSTDSRSLPERCLFVALKGERSDGHDYIPNALEAGVGAVLCARLPENLRPDRAYILVEDTLTALKALASWYRGQFSIPVVQITGSVGKTTTKEMVAAVLSQRLRTHRTQGNFNNHIGAPLTLLAMPADTQAAVVETGMNHFGEIRYLGEMVKPTVAVITNIGDAHIEYLGSRQGILEAKCEIFEHLAPGGLAVLSGDDDLLAALDLPFPTALCGRGERCQYRVTEVADRGVRGVDCTLVTPRDTYTLHIPAPGVHMIYPAAMAAAIGEHLGLTREEISRGVAAYTPAGSRMRVIRGSRDRVLLDDCYNANPQSMAAALKVLAGEEHTLAILGDMGELGDLSPQAHREVGQLARELGIGTLVAVGEKSREMAEGAKGMDVRWFPTVDSALEALPDMMTRDGLVIEVKASHAMHFERIVEELKKRL